MKEIKDLIDKLLSERPAHWNELPDFPLYKDQLVSYMVRQVIDSQGEGQISSAMINNYVKDKLLPKPEGKKYNKEHIAALTQVSVLKQVLSVKDIGLLMAEKAKAGDFENFYEEFINTLDRGLSHISEKIQEDWSKKELWDIILNFAVESYCNRLVCSELLNIAISSSTSES